MTLAVDHQNYNTHLHKEDQKSASVNFSLQSFPAAKSFL
jgi:hypothetical protein